MTFAWVNYAPTFSTVCRLAPQLYFNQPADLPDFHFTLSDPVTSVTTTKDAQTMLVTTLNSAIHLMDREDGSELQRYTGHKNTSYRIHSSLGHGEATVLSGDEDGKLWSWDLADGKHVKMDEKLHTKSILWVEQSPDNTVNQVVTAGSDGDVQVWKM